MELINQDKRDGYIYDPIIKQYDTSFWKTTAGTPAISSNLLRFNAAGVASYIEHIYADFEIQLTVPAVPTSGDVRQWGFIAPATSKLGAAYFDITGTAFTAKVIDNQGTTTTKTLTWSAGYTATATVFRIRWEADQIFFYIANVVVASVSAPTVIIPAFALPIRILNSNSDNMDMTYMAVRRAASIV